MTHDQMGRAREGQRKNDRRSRVGPSRSIIGHIIGGTSPALAVAAILLLTGFAGTAAAQPPPEDLSITMRPIEAPPLPGPEAQVMFTNKWLNGAQCAGHIHYVDRHIRGGAEAAVHLPFLAPIQGALNETDNVSGPEAEPVTTLGVIMLVLAVAAVLIAATALALQAMDSMTEPWAEWDFTCTAEAFGVEANGYDGGPLRQIRIATVLEGDIPPATAGTPCTYTGVVDNGCAYPAFFRNDGTQPAGNARGASKMVWNEETQRVEYDPPLPVTGDVCISPALIAINESQIPLLDNVVRPATVGVGEVCSSACIVWDQAVGCLASDEEEGA